MTKIQTRRGTSTQWSTANPVLSDGEQGWDSTLRNTKTGNGVTAWNSLAFDNANKANLNSPTFTGTVGGITKSMVGLGNVDNTADSAKPVSTAQQSALNGKLNAATQNVTDWNTAASNGWWMGYNMPNAPVAGQWFIGTVVVHNALYLTQTVHQFTADSATDTASYRRSMNNGVWSAWYKLMLSQTESDARYLLGSTKGVANGVASLGTDGKVPAGQLPPAANTTVLQTKLTNYQPEIVINPFRMYGPKGTRLNLPSHIPGNTTGEATHPSVAFRAEGWGTGAYPYWMAVTPYQGAQDSMEDPNVLCSRDGITWVKPAGAPSPLDDAPGSPAAYNSDTEIAFGPDDALYVFWRNLDPAATGNEEKIYYRRSTDGITWEPKVLVYQSNQNTIRLLSPTILWEDGAWTMWAVDIVTSPDRIVRLRSNTSLPSWAGGWSSPTAITYTNPQPYQDNKGPWHVAVTKAYGRYHMLVNDNRLNSPPPEGDLVYLTSPDGIVWTSAVNPCLPRVQAGQHDMMYRATMVPAVERGVQGFRVWYGALSYYTNPQVWGVYRTFISDAPHALRGEVTVTLAAANGSVPTGAQAAITFDPPFKDNPDIVLTTNSTLLGLAYDQLTGGGFVIFAENFTAYAANNVKIRWTATEPY